MDFEELQDTEEMPFPGRFNEAESVPNQYDVYYSEAGKRTIVLRGLNANDEYEAPQLQQFIHSHYAHFSTFEQEIKEREGVERPRVRASFYHHRGFTYAVLASNDEKKRLLFEEDFKRVFAIYTKATNGEDATEDASGLTAQLVPYTYMYYAYFLHTI